MEQNPYTAASTLAVELAVELAVDAQLSLPTPLYA
jgi:hypothetical protein